MRSSISSTSRVTHAMPTETPIDLRMPFIFPRRTLAAVERRNKSWAKPPAITDRAKGARPTDSSSSQEMDDRVKPRHDENGHPATGANPLALVEAQRHI